MHPGRGVPPVLGPRGDGHGARGRGEPGERRPGGQPLPRSGGQVPEIDEDEPPLHLLTEDYRRYYRFA